MNARNIMKAMKVFPLAAALLALSGRVDASALTPGIGVVDNAPAATLLLPYFEVDLNNPAGMTTLFSINNASATAVLAHVTFWTDLSVPTFAYNVYLTGYDIQTFNVRDILTGNMARTASAGQDPTDTISPKGPLSQDINFASCSGLLPGPPLAAIYIQHLQLSHTGLPSPLFFSGRCSGQNKGDNVARGYITIDTVNNCTLRFPGDVGYFGPGGTGDATNQNVLWGDYFYINTALNTAEGDALVHIQASSTDPRTSTSGAYTFYGRYDTPPWTAADNREPLATNFAPRFVNGGPFSGGTSLIVWRDPKVVQAPFTCPATFGRPSYYPLGQEGLVIFDEQEQPVLPPTYPYAPQPPNTGLIPFPAAAQRVQVNGATLPTPFNFGWLYLNLNTTVAPAGSVPPVDPAAAQAWVTVTHSAFGRFSVGYSASQLDSATQALHFVP